MWPQVKNLLICPNSLYKKVYLVTFFRNSNDEASAPDCFERDTVAVSTEEIFTNNCEDIHGNKYEENSETSSCCGCLM